jgi:predicted HTH transcriptional regulator
MFNENQYIEFKPNFNSDVIETFVAFANTKGIFKDIEWVERYGTGIWRIKDYFLNSGSHEPVFENFQHRFRVIAYTLQWRIAEKGTENGEKISLNQQKIIDNIVTNSRISIKELSASVEIAESKVKANITILKNAWYSQKNRRRQRWILENNTVKCAGELVFFHPFLYLCTQFFYLFFILKIGRFIVVQLSNKEKK